MASRGSDAPHLSADTGTDALKRDVMAAPQTRPSPPAAASGASSSGLAQSGTLPQDARRSHPQYQQQLGNAGMATGAAVGVMGDGSAGSVGGDMVMGGVVGGIIGQRIAQAENHAYWSDKAMEYRDGRAAGTIPPPEKDPDKKTSWFSKEGRAERRAERWERRAKRRDGLE